MRILFDKNVPVGVRRFLLKHEIHTFDEMQWADQLENGELLKMAEQSGFDVMVTSDQNIRYQQNLTGRQLALVVLGSNIWPVVRDHGMEITAKVGAATPGSYDFIEMSLSPKPRKKAADPQSVSSPRQWSPFSFAGKNDFRQLRRLLFVKLTDALRMRPPVVRSDPFHSV